MSRESNKRHRGETSLIIYGRRSVLEAIETETVEVNEIRVAKSVAADFRRRLREAADRRQVPVDAVAEHAVHELSRDRRHDQGVAARIRMTNVTDVETFVESLKGAAAKHRTSVLVMDAITNPQNIGMIIRSAAASGMNAIVWPLSGCPWVSGLVIKTSAATIYRMPLIRCDTIDEAIHALRAGGFHILGLDAAADAYDLFTFDPPHRGAYILGAETTGISPEVHDLLDARLRIPMAGDVESLNVAVSAALVGYRVGLR